jgi:hypothetical protein
VLATNRRLERMGRELERATGLTAASAARNSVRGMVRFMELTLEGTY